MIKKSKKIAPVKLRKKSGSRNVGSAPPDFYEKTCGILKGGRLLELSEQERHKEKEHEDRKIAGC